MYLTKSQQKEVAKMRLETLNSKRWARQEPKEEKDHLETRLIEDAIVDNANKIFAKCAASREGAGEAMLDDINIDACHFAEMVVHLLAKDRRNKTSLLQDYLESEIVANVYKTATLRANLEVPDDL